MKKIKRKLKNSNLLGKVLKRLPFTAEFDAETKLVILASYRSGSNYLMYLLNKHPNIEITGELFNISNMAADSYRAKHPKSFLEAHFRTQNLNCRVKGLKLMYGQLSAEDLNEENWPPYISDRIKSDIETVKQNIQIPSPDLHKHFSEARDFLANQECLRVIHLKRRNLLDLLISTKRAFTEDNWIGKKYSNKFIELSVLECEEFFSKIEEQRAQYVSLFSSCPVYSLFYEDLVENTEFSVSKILDFLQLEQNYSLSSETKKQGTGRKRQQVKNFDSLKEHFNDSKWSKFFTEE